VNIKYYLRDKKLAICLNNKGWLHMDTERDIHHVYVAELDTVNYELTEEPVSSETDFQIKDNCRKNIQVGFMSVE